MTDFENLKRAVVDKNKAEVLRLLDAGVDVNAKDRFGRTVLMFAVDAEKCSVHFIRFLLKNGADVNAKADVNVKTAPDDVRGRTVLMFAVAKGNTKCTRLLLKQPGINVNANTTVDDYRPEKDDRTALMIAAENGNVEDARLLLEHGALVDAKTGVEGWEGEGDTALILAAKIWGGERRRQKGADMARLLLKNGANIREVDEEGRTALDVAWPKPEFVSVLMDYADPETNLHYFNLGDKGLTTKEMYQEASQSEHAPELLKMMETRCETYVDGEIRKTAAVFASPKNPLNAAGDLVPVMVATLKDDILKKCHLEADQVGGFVRERYDAMMARRSEYTKRNETLRTVLNANPSMTDDEIAEFLKNVHSLAEPNMIGLIKVVRANPSMSDEEIAKQLKGLGSLSKPDALQRVQEQRHALSNTVVAAASAAAPSAAPSAASSLRGMAGLSV